MSSSEAPPPPPPATRSDFVVNGVNMRLLLQSMLAVENTSRRRAEAEWDQLIPIKGAAHALLSMAVERGAQMDVSALCFILLKNNLKRFSEEDVGFVQSTILQVLAGCGSPQISKLVAGVAVSVALLNGGKWEALYSALEGMLSADPVTENDKICNALVCISELCSVLPADVLVVYVNLSAALINIALNPTSAKSHAAFNNSSAAAGTPPTVSPSGTPPMRPLDAPIQMLFGGSGDSASNSNALYAKTHPYSSVSQQMALRAIADMALVVGLKEGHTLATVCTSAYSALVAIGCTPLENDATLNKIAHEALKIAAVVGDFQPSVATAEAFIKVMGALAQSAETYQYVALNGEANVDDEVAAAVARCSSTRWDFVAGFFRSKRRASIVYDVVGNPSSYAEFAAIAIKYCGLGHQQQSDWILDPNAFLKGEDDREDQVSLVVRDAATEACEQLCKRGGVDVWAAIFAACSEVLASGASSWVQRESALFLLSEIISRRFAIIKTAPADSHSALLALAEAVATVDLAAGVNHFLIIRALLFFRTVVHGCASILPVQRIALQLLGPAVQTLQSADTLVACAAVLLLCKLVPKCPKADVAGHAPSSLLTILSLASRSDHELLYQLLELTLLWLRASGGPSVREMACLAEVPPMVLAVWQSQLDDPNVAELVVDLYCFMLKRAPQSHGGFATVLPWMASTLGGLESLTAMCTIPSVLVIVRDMIKYGSDAMITEVGNVLLGALCRLLLNTEDSGVTNAASNTLASLIKRLGPAVHHCTVMLPPSHFQSSVMDDGGIPPLDEEDEAVSVAAAMQAIATKMLAPSTKEFTLLNAGGFLKELVPIVAASTGLGQFLFTLVDRALTLQMDSTFQEVLLPIAFILGRECGAAMVGLEATGRMLPLFERWLPKQKGFEGKLVLRHTTLALSAVLRLIGPAGGADIGGRLVKWGKKKSGGVIPLRLAVFVALGKQLNAALKSRSSEYKSDVEDDLESLSDDDDPEDYDAEDGESDEDSYDDIDPNDCGRDPYACNDDDDDEDEEGEEEEADDGRTAKQKSSVKRGPSSAYTSSLAHFGAFVAVLGPDAAQGGFFTAKEIESLQKFLAASAV